MSRLAFRSVTVIAAQVDPAGQVDGGAGVAEGDGDVDLVQLGVDRAEGGPAQVGVRAEPAGGVGRFGEHLVRGAALVVLGGGDGAAEQDRPVHRQEFGCLFLDLAV